MNRRLTLGLAVVALVIAGAAQAQTPPGRQTPPRRDPWTVRGFGDIGLTRFSAEKSFMAILGTSSGRLFGGGVEVDLGSGVFVAARASRFRQDGHRVFVFQDKVFNLAVPATVTVTPVQIDAGYRFSRQFGVVPYAGGGIGWHRYQETSNFASADENVATTARGYHLLGGAEARVTRLVSAAVEGQWATVPKALGADSGSVSAAFDEHDLGGSTVRVKVIVGF